MAVAHQRGGLQDRSWWDSPAPSSFGWGRRENSSRAMLSLSTCQMRTSQNFTELFRGLDMGVLEAEAVSTKTPPGQTFHGEAETRTFSGAVNGEEWCGPRSPLCPRWCGWKTGGFLVAETDHGNEKAKSQLERQPPDRARLGAEGDTRSPRTRDSITAGEKATVIFQDPVRWRLKTLPQRPP